MNDRAEWQVIPQIGGDSEELCVVVLDGKRIGFLRRHVVSRRWYGVATDNGRMRVSNEAPSMEAAAEMVVDHVLDQRAEQRDRRHRGIVHMRRPPLPWHSPAYQVTVCGREASDSVRLIGGTADTHRLCKVCAGLIPYYPDAYEAAPVDVLRAWLDDSNAERRARLVRDLVAIGRLAASRPDDLEAERALMVWAR